MVKLVDTPDSGSGRSNPVGVRVPSSAPLKGHSYVHKNMTNPYEEKLKLSHIAMRLYKAFMAIGIITVILHSPAHGQDAKYAPPEVVKAIPISLVYEGSIVSIIWESQKKRC